MATRRIQSADPKFEHCASGSLGHLCLVRVGLFCKWYGRGMPHPYVDPARDNEKCRQEWRHGTPGGVRHERFPEP